MSISRIAVLSALLLSACYPKTGVPPGPFSPEQIARGQARRPAVTEDSLEQGRKLFIAQCGGCHSHPDINAIALDRWPSILPRMVARTKMYSSANDMLGDFIAAAHD